MCRSILGRCLITNLCLFISCVVAAAAVAVFVVFSFVFVVVVTVCLFV